MRNRVCRSVAVGLLVVCFGCSGDVQTPNEITDTDANLGADTNGTTDAEGDPAPSPTDCDPCGDDDAPLVNATPLWFSGFENGWPGGEWVEYGPSAPLVDQGLEALWNFSAAENGVTPIEGDTMYKGWITGAASDSHRAYPALHSEDVYEPHPYVVNRFYVWADVDMQSDWMHFATWCANTDWIVWTMSIRQDAWNGANYWVELAHLWGRETRLSDAALDYPLRQWVRFTAYIDFTGSGYTRIWMDGTPIYEASDHTLISDGSDTLMRAHWGMYAGGAVDNGVQYNDSIQLWALDEPLSDLEAEPLSPFDGAGVATPGDH